MSAPPPDGAPNIFPALKYRDAPAAIAWLNEAFGFSTGLEVSGPAGTVAHAELRLGPGVVMLGSKREPAVTPWDEVDHGIYVHITDIDTHYQRAKAAGASIVRDLADTDYGSREYSVLDPEGHLWSFGTYRP